MKLTITVDVPMPKFSSDDLNPAEEHLLNARRDAETRAMVDKAIRAALIKRGAWEPKMKVSVRDS